MARATDYEGDVEYAEATGLSKGKLVKQAPAILYQIESLTGSIESLEHEFDELYTSLDHVFVSRPMPSDDDTDERLDHSDTVSRIVALTERIVKLRMKMVRLRDGLEV